jgi:hypothetical protein
MTDFSIPTGAVSNYPAIPRRYRAIQSMVIDYALGAAIIGLNPFQNLLILTLCIAGALTLKMMWDIMRKWSFPRRYSVISIAGFLFNLLGALAMGFMAWLTLIIIGTFFPVMNRFAVSAALMTFTWIIGSVTNQFFLNGCLNLEADAEHGEQPG